MSTSGSTVHPLIPSDADGIALIDGDRDEVLTYAQLRARVDERSDQLSHLRGRLVLLGATTSVATVVDYLSLVGLGATVALLDPRSPSDTVAGWHEAYAADATWGFRDHPDVLDGPPAASETASETGGPAREALLLSTSGSTGSPKFVRLSLANLTANAGQIAEALHLVPTDRALAHLPLFYTYGLSVLNSHLAIGSTVVLTEASAIRPELWQVVRDREVTTIPGVPYSYEMFARMRLAEMDLPSLRTLTQAGGRMSPDRVLEFGRLAAGWGGGLWVMYGQTEATARISVLPPEDAADAPGSVGRALPGSSVSVPETGADGTGELVVTGPNVMLGYATNRSEVDGTDAQQGTLGTGDLGRVDDNGLIWITGRSKRIAKVFGARVNLDDIERSLAQFGSLAAVDDADGIAVFVESSEADAGPSRQMERTAGLPPRSVRVHAIAELPLTPAGKVDYESLRDRCRT